MTDYVQSNECLYEILVGNKYAQINLFAIPSGSVQFCAKSIQ